MIKYKYARNKQGKIVDIDEISTNSREEYVCISCGQKLFPRLGEQRQHHFYHPNDTIGCNPETYLHNLGKEKIYNSLKERIQNNQSFELIYKRNLCKHFNDIYCNSCNSEERYNILKYYKNVYLEKYSGEYKPDILLESKDNKNKLFIEIVVTHPSTDEKKKNNKIIEIIIKEEKDIIEILKNGIDENDSRISLVNFKKDITILMHCNENDCVNYVDCLQPQTGKKIIAGRINVFGFKILLKRENIFKYRMTNEEFKKNASFKYIDKFKKDKKKIKSINICKYITVENENVYYLIIEMDGVYTDKNST